VLAVVVVVVVVLAVVVVVVVVLAVVVVVVVVLAVVVAAILPVVVVVVGPVGCLHRYASKACLMSPADNCFRFPTRLVAELGIVLK